MAPTAGEYIQSLQVHRQQMGRYCEIDKKDGKQCNWQSMVEFVAQHTVSNERQTKGGRGVLCESVRKCNSVKHDTAQRRQSRSPTFTIVPADSVATGC